MTTDAIRAATAERKVRLFMAEQSEMMKQLAYCAALPVALDPDLLHLIRVNFFYGLPFTAESDFLLSKLCVEIGDGLYEIPPETRELLLRNLYAGQPARARQMAALLWDYSAGGAWPGNEQLTRAQQLTALNLLAPEKAQAWLDEAEAARRGGLLSTNAREWFVAMRAEVRFQTDIAASAQAPPPQQELVKRQRHVAIFHLLVDYFTYIEIRELTYLLGLDPDQLPGDNKVDKARELVLQVVRLGQMDELEAVLRRERPLAPLEYTEPSTTVAQTQASEEAPHFISPERRMALHRVLSRYFSLSELATLSFELGIEYDALPGDRRSDKAREIVLYMEKLGLLAELEAALRRERPSLPLNYAEPIEAPKPTQLAEESPRLTESERREALVEIITQAYNFDELQTLCFSLAVDYEILSGISLQDKARDLVNYLERQGLVYLLEDQLRRDREEVYDQRLATPQVPRAEEESAAPQFSDPKLREALIQFIIDFFDLERLKDLALRLRIDYEDLKGNTTQVKARELVDYLRRRGRLGSLDKALRRELPAEYAMVFEGQVPSGPIRLSTNEQYEIAKILERTHWMQTPDDRRANLKLAGLENLVDAMDLNGPVNDVAYDLVFALENYGAIAPGETALGRLLNYIRDDPTLPQWAREYTTVTIRRLGLVLPPNRLSQRLGGSLLPVDERQQLVKILSSTYDLHGGAQGWAQFLQNAGLRRFESAIDLNGPTRTVAALLVGLLEPFGLLPENPSYHALGALLNYIMQLPDTPPDDARYLAEILVKYRLVTDEAYLDEMKRRYAFEDANEEQPPAETARDPRLVFISHATADAEFAHLLAADLARDGYRGWIAPESLRPGEQWLNALERGLAESGVYLLVLSPAAAMSSWVQYETRAALELQLAGEVRFMSALLQRGEFPPEWQDFQVIRFDRDYAAGLADLRKVLPPLASDIQLTNDDLSPLVQILANYVMFETSADRRTTLLISGVAEFARVDLEGASRVVAARVLDRLNKYGRTPEGDLALGRLLAYLRTDEVLPPRDRAVIDEIIERYGLLGRVGEQPGELTSSREIPLHRTPEGNELSDFRTMLDEARAIFEEFIRQRERFIKLIQQNHPGELPATGAYDDAFRRMYDLFNEEEMEAFRALRDITKVRTHGINSRIRDWAESHDVLAMFPGDAPEVQTLERELVNLRVHLAGWFAAYEETFLPDPRRAIVSLGDEKSPGVPWPAGLERAVDALLGRSEGA